MNKSLRSLVIATLSMWWISACAEDQKTLSTFDTSAEAQESYEELEKSGVNPMEVMDQVFTSAGFSEEFDGSADIGIGSAVSKRRHAGLAKTSSFSFIYDDATHYWTLDADTTVEGITWDLFYRVRFTPRNIFGLPSDSTKRMEYETVLGISGTLQDTTNAGILTLQATLSNNFDVQSDEPFVTNTNYLTIIGTTGSHSDFAYTLGVLTYEVSLDADYDVDSLVIFGPANDLDDEPEYPLSGSIGFTVDYDASGPNISESYYVAGRITFDGDETAILEYGGFTFILNLETGEITPIG